MGFLPRPRRKEFSRLGRLISFWSRGNRIFQESARRTYLIATFFLRTFHLLKGHIDPERMECGPKSALSLSCSYTLSAHLWEAEDLSDFFAAWKTKKHFVIKNAE